jgi:ABC-type lipoprotein release transport system permease subunit
MLAQFVFAISASDPLTLVASSLLLCGVALAATLVSALCAMRIDPIVALRYE